MHNIYAVPLQNGDVPVAHGDAVRRGGGAVQRSQLLKPCDGRLTVARDALVHLALRFGKMNVHPPAVRFAYFAVGTDDVRLAGVLRVNGKVDADTPVLRVVVFFKQLHRLWDLCTLLHGLVFVEALHAAVDIRLHARFRDGSDCLGGEKVHIGKARRAARKHFKDGKAAARRGVRRNEPVLNGKDLVKQPFPQRQSAPHAAQQHHGRMIVAVDETGHEELTLHILVFLILPCRSFRTDIINGIAAHAEKAVQRGVRAVLSAQQKIAVFKKNAHDNAPTFFTAYTLPPNRQQCKKYGGKKLRPQPELFYFCYFASAQTLKLSLSVTERLKTR